MQWSARRTTAAVLGALGTALVVGVPTVVIPNPVFGRAVPVTWWSYPVLAVVSVLSGLLLATYVRLDATPTVDAPESDVPGSAEAAPGEPGADRAQRRGVVSAAVSFFAVGCPVCNKVVLLTLGASGAVTWFAPFQPLLAVGSIAGLVWALRTRWSGATACAVLPASPVIPWSEDRQPDSPPSPR